jgi:hypothetical protein
MILFWVFGGILITLYLLYNFLRLLRLNLENKLHIEAQKAGATQTGCPTAQLLAQAPSGELEVSRRKYRLDSGIDVEAAIIVRRVDEVGPVVSAALH